MTLTTGLVLLVAPAASAAAPPSDAQLRGVALEDLGEAERALSRCLSAQRIAGRRKPVSVTFVERDADRLVVDVLLEDRRFERFNGRAGGLGVVRLGLERGATGARCGLAAVETLAEWPVAEMRGRLTVSLSDMAAVYEDLAGPFRRVLPVGIGAVDRVRLPGELSTLTPLTELGRLDRRVARRSVRAPRYYRGLPYIPLIIPRASVDAEGAQRLGYGRTRVAFHAHMGRRFVRGYTSHGCLTARDAELRELSALLHATEDRMPLRVRAAPLDDAAHPYPVADEYFYELVNFGTDAAPEYRVRGGLYVIEKRRATPPDAARVVGRFMDREAPAHVAKTDKDPQLAELGSTAP